MATFAYEARNESGNLVTGIIDAVSIDDAGQRLGAQNIFVVRLGPTADRSRGVSRAIWRGGHRVKRQSVVWFTSQLSIMVETGINISEALESLAHQTRDAGFQQVLTSVARQVSEGKPLSQSLATHPRAFPEIMPALIRAGEMSGTMGLILSRLGAYLQNQAQIVRRLRAALIYPAFMLFMSVAVSVFMLTGILPRFAKIFADKGAALPGPTRLLMTISDLLIKYDYVWIVLTLAATAGGYIWVQTAPGRRQLDWLKLHTPIFKNIYRKLYLARAFRTLGTVIGAGVPLTDSIDIAHDISDNTYMRDLWSNVNHKVVHGERLAGPLLNCPYVDESIGQMVDSGDKSGQLGKVFDRLAAYCEEDFDTTVKTSMQFIEPAMIMILGGVIGFIAIAMLMPMFSVARVVAN